MYSIYVDFYSQFTFWATLLGLTGNVRTLSIACWRVCSRLPIRDSWTFFARSYGWDVMSRYFEIGALQRGWVTLSENCRCKGTSPPNHWWYQKTRLFVLSHCEYRIILSSFFGYNTSVWQTDKQTDGQTELLWLIQLSALQATRPRCRNGTTMALIVF